MITTVLGVPAAAMQVMDVLILTMEQEILMDMLAVCIAGPIAVTTMMATSILGPCAAHVVEGLNQAVWNPKSCKY